MARADELVAKAALENEIPTRGDDAQAWVAAVRARVTEVELRAVRARERRPTRDRKYCPVITKPRVEPPAPRQGRCELQVGLSTGRTRRRHDAVNCSARASVCIGGVRHLIV